MFLQEEFQRYPPFNVIQLRVIQSCTIKVSLVILGGGGGRQTSKPTETIGQTSLVYFQNGYERVELINCGHW